MVSVWGAGGEGCGLDRGSEVRSVRGIQANGCWFVGVTRKSHSSQHISIWGVSVRTCRGTAWCMRGERTGIVSLHSARARNDESDGDGDGALNEWGRCRALQLVCSSKVFDGARRRRPTSEIFDQMGLGGVTACDYPEDWPTRESEESNRGKNAGETSAGKDSYRLQTELARRLHGRWKGLRWNWGRAVCPKRTIDFARNESVGPPDDLAVRAMEGARGGKWGQIWEEMWPGMFFVRSWVVPAAGRTDRRNRHGGRRPPNWDVEVLARPSGNRQVGHVIVSAQDALLRPKNLFMFRGFGVSRLSAFPFGVLVPGFLLNSWLPILSGWPVLTFSVTYIPLNPFPNFDRDVIFSAARASNSCSGKKQFFARTS
ncbi:hypothetical protein DFH09DRAFT_1096743 [Mycena vulgaris]|nr:hypothetical protein DFH09DRAFT_1096743 [Mycena vulgaris]